jgi:predicted Zn-dependent peptidase
MTMLLQSQLLDTIRQELGGTYSITATPDADKSPRSQYTVRIDWTCDPARTTALVQRVFEEIERLKAMTFSPRQVALIRDSLLREYQQNSQENGYRLNEIARRYADGEAGGDVPIANMRDEIAALTGEAVQDAARTYLNTGNYLKLTLIPETN